MELQAINEEQRVYVMPCGKGVHCYGWDVLDRKARAVAAWLVSLDGARAAEAREAGGRSLEDLDRHAIGTAPHFAACNAILDHATIHTSVFGGYCPAELVPALVGLEGRRVEADYFGERIRFRVGRSTGWLPAHLRLHNARSHSGEALIADRVRNVRAID